MCCGNTIENIKNLYFSTLLFSLVPLFPLFHLKKINSLYVKIFIYFFYIYFSLYRIYVFGGNKEERGTSKRQIRCVNFRQILKSRQICLYADTICWISCNSCFFCSLVVICYKHIPTLRPRQKSS